jgi:aspartate ammonia-lyase
MTLGHHSALNHACALGCLELNPFLPLVAHSLLESQRMLAEAAYRLRTHCVEGITPTPRLFEGMSRPPPRRSRP